MKEINNKQIKKGDIVIIVMSHGSPVWKMKVVRVGHRTIFGRVNFCDENGKDVKPVSVYKMMFKADDIESITQCNN